MAKFLVINPNSFGGGDPIYINVDQVAYVVDGRIASSGVDVHFVGGTKLKLRGIWAQEYFRLKLYGKLPF